MTSVRFVTFKEIVPTFRGKRVAVVGSAPSCERNPVGLVDDHDVVVRVNNYKTGRGQGKRCDVHYAFYGSSIRSKREDLIADGVKLCMCKLPNSKPLTSAWHEDNKKPHGVDYHYIYRIRKDFWFCDTFVPDDARFLSKFELLGKHQPTTGFAAILDVIECGPKSLYLTGFDFFSSGLHNVNEKWKPGDPTDPICHRPDLERDWVAEAIKRLPLTLDAELQKQVLKKKGVPA